MDPNPDDKQSGNDQPVDLDSAIDELEGLLTHHDEELHQAACPEAGEEDIPVLLDVVETAGLTRHDRDPAASPPPVRDGEPVPQDTAMEREPLLPFEFIDDITPTPEPPAAPTPGSGTQTLSPPPGEADPGDRDVQGPPMPPAPEPGAERIAPGELSPQLLDELEAIIDQELQRVTAAAKQSILATLRAHLDESGRTGLDVAMGASGPEHIPAATPDNAPSSDAEAHHPPLRPFDPFNDPD